MDVNWHELGILAAIAATSFGTSFANGLRRKVIDHAVEVKTTPLVEQNTSQAEQIKALENRCQVLEAFCFKWQPRKEPNCE